MKKEIKRSLIRLGLHNGENYITKAALINDDLAKEVIALMASLEKWRELPVNIQSAFNQVKYYHKQTGYINQAFAVLAFKEYEKEPGENIKIDAYKII